MVLVNLINSINCENIINYDVDTFCELIEAINKKYKLFLLLETSYSLIPIYHSLTNNDNIHELKNTYFFLLLNYDIVLLDEILYIEKNNKNNINKTIELINKLNQLFKNKILYNDSIFLLFLARNLNYKNLDCYENISTELKNNKCFIADLVKIRYSFLKYASYNIRNNK